MDWWLGFGLMSGIAFAATFFISLVLRKFVALKQRPRPRAAWTIGVAYLITVAIFVFGAGLPEYELFAPVYSVPGAALSYALTKSEFAKTWVEDPSLLPEGATLANDDWVIGLAVVVAVGSLLALKVFLRVVTR